MERIGLRLWLDEYEIPFLKDGDAFIVQVGHGTVSLQTINGLVVADGKGPGFPPAELLTRLDELEEDPYEFDRAYGQNVNK